MDDPRERAQELLVQWDDELRRELPDGADIFDAHTHLGTDIDGMVGIYADLILGMEKYGISRCFMFCLDEPDRHPAFRAGNDRTLAYAERSDGKLIPFVRLDLSEDPIAEATRCLDLGAKGIKLHPRAQKFLLNDERLSPIFELAADRKVPILIHGGRGLPPIADDLARMVERYPQAQLIVAHAGIADLASLADRLGGKAGVFFDTSVWSPLDLLGLYRLVGPEQVVYASDYPYGQQPASLLTSLRTARLGGLSDEQVRDVLAGNAHRIAAGEPPREPSAPKGTDTFSQPMSFARIHQYLSMATPLLWTRQPDRVGVLGLALNATQDRTNGHREELDEIRELLLAARDMWRALPEEGDEKDAREHIRATFRLIHLADIVAVTTPA
ncbi:MAG TPA: amidohydrolase family protein [Gaiellaceae bacterium]|nr:amidohydrolase family protein [Gaiellaceae bacterium]